MLSVAHLLRCNASRLWDVRFRVGLASPSLQGRADIDGTRDTGSAQETGFAPGMVERSPLCMASSVGESRQAEMLPDPEQDKGDPRHSCQV